MKKKTKSEIAREQKLELAFVAEAMQDAKHLSAAIEPLLIEKESIMDSDVGRRLSNIQATLDKLRPKYQRALSVIGYWALTRTARNAAKNK